MCVCVCVCVCVWFITFYSFMVLVSLSPALTGILFPKQLEYAYSAIRIWQALGFTVAFASAELTSVETRLLLLLVVVLLAASCNFILEVKTQPWQQLLCTCRRQMSKGISRSEKEAAGASRETPPFCERTGNLSQLPSSDNAMFSEYGSTWSRRKDGQVAPNSVRRSSSYSKPLDLSDEEDGDEDTAEFGETNVPEDIDVGCGNQPISSDTNSLELPIHVQVIPVAGRRPSIISRSHSY